MSDDERRATAREPLPRCRRGWHAPARDALALRARWPHALLIHGPDGIGKRALALHFARALLCETPARGRQRLRRVRGLPLRRRAASIPTCASSSRSTSTRTGNVTPTEVIKIDAIRSADAVVAAHEPSRRREGRRHRPGRADERRRRRTRC